MKYLLLVLFILLMACERVVPCEIGCDDTHNPIHGFKYRDPEVREDITHCHPCSWAKTEDEIRVCGPSAGRQNKVKDPKKGKF